MSWRNAIDAVHADTGIIDISTDVKKDMVSVLIKDNGEGISGKDLKNVSKPFLPLRLKARALGLAVSKQVVVLHGGSIIFSSVKGKGTTVAITIADTKDEKCAIKY